MPVTRRQLMSLAALGVASAPLHRLSAFQNSQPPATRFETIRRNVGYFAGRGGTIGWLVNPDALVVVDTQFPDTAALCLQGLGERSKREIDLLFNTHHHGDHTGGNAVFKPKSRKIVAHARVPELQKQGAAQQPAGQTPPVVADVTFDTTWSDKAGDEQVSARHYGPGHTGGDSVIQFEQAQVVHMGDLLFHERHPFVDRAAGASIQNWMKTLETIVKSMPADTIYIAGHSKDGLPVTLDRKALERFRDYFDAVLTHTRRGIAGKQSKEEIARLETLPGFDGYQSAPPRLTLGTVLGVAYDELTSNG